MFLHKLSESRVFKSHKALFLDKVNKCIHINKLHHRKIVICRIMDNIWTQSLFLLTFVFDSEF